MERFDLEGFLNATFDEIEIEMHVRLDRGAREALIAPALEHEDELLDELQSGAVTLPRLREKIASQVAIAGQIAGEERHFQLQRRKPGAPTKISAGAARLSMKRHCAYLFWC
jgi:hypothetical protein